MDNKNITKEEQKIIESDCPTDSEEPLEIEFDVVFKKLIKSI